MRSMSRPGRNRSPRPSVVSRERGPQHLGEGLDVLSAGHVGDCLSEFGERRPQLDGGVLGCESQSCGAGEHRVIQHRVLGGEAAVRVGDPAQRLIPPAGTAAAPSAEPRRAR